ncbi:outer membrane beta-barrel protein [Aquimarina pacifica]|uniref:outer membrane beta-barrel protein n=1 Tax=Aquimarina pacifica TaxID=1296415 RepID=UPI001267E510|nr:outer membrane beta-barrel protein [Aquimarina pacifica]
MMKYNYPYFLFFSLLVVFSVNSQRKQHNPNPWIVGLGVNVVYDSGELLKGMFNLKENYTFSNPLRMSLEKRFEDDFGFEVSTSFNKFSAGKTFDNNVLTEDINFFALDGLLKYYITNNHVDKHRSIFEGYLAMGFGSSFYDRSSATNVNLGAGINFYISESLRLNGQVLGKLSVDDNPTSTNYLHYNFGLIYRI